MDKSAASGNIACIAGAKLGIGGAHPSAMHFHILKNLNERATQAFQKLFQGRIAIPVTSGTQDIRYETLIGNSADRAKLVKRLCGEGRTKGEIALLTGLSQRMVKKYSELPICELRKQP